MDNLKKSLENVKCRALSNIAENVGTATKQYPVLINCSSYPLNKSKSKFVAVGLSSYGGFAPMVHLHGVKADWTTFDEAEWKDLLENQGVITNSMCSRENSQSVLHIGTKIFVFHDIGSTRVVTIRSITSEICLAFESVCELWDMIPLVEHRIHMLKGQNFSEFYVNVIKGVAHLPGDPITNISNVLIDLLGFDNAACMHEMLRFACDIVHFDLQFEIGAQKYVMCNATANK